MPLGQVLEEKTLHSGDTVKIETDPRPEGDEVERVRVVITDKLNIASMRLPHAFQAQTRERAKAIFDDIKPEDTYESVFERCHTYFE